jgi:glyoxylase-like metal-dependent hydrolase (beta-lactamase superfamily II)
MSTAAEPRPAALPLPGGRDGATVTLNPLLVARMVAPPALFHREEGRLATLKAHGFRVPRDQWLEIPAVAFLVEHPGAGPLLIDTGFHPSVAVEPRQALGRLGGLHFKDVRMEPDQAVSAQLRERGIATHEIRVVVMTHLHSDHASGIADYPESTFVVSVAEWAAASSGGPLRAGYIRRQFDHAFDWRTLDFEGSEADSFATFGRSFDLLGDGSVRLVYTPGHSAGHLSVVLRLRGREALVAGDAIYTLRTLRESRLPHAMADEHLFRRSLREIQLYEKETPGALIVAGHDMEQWRTLEARYE